MLALEDILDRLRARARSFSANSRVIPFHSTERVSQQPRPSGSSTASASTVS